jgi:hypothetical protein
MNISLLYFFSGNLLYFFNIILIQIQYSVLNHPKYLDLLNQKDNVENQISSFMGVVVSAKEELAKCKEEMQQQNGIFATVHLVL